MQTRPNLFAQRICVCATIQHRSQLGISLSDPQCLHHNADWQSYNKILKKMKNSYIVKTHCTIRMPLFAAYVYCLKMFALRPRLAVCNWMPNSLFAGLRRFCINKTKIHGFRRTAFICSMRYIATMPLSTTTLPLHKLVKFMVLYPIWYSFSFFFYFFHSV